MGNDRRGQCQIWCPGPSSTCPIEVFLIRTGLGVPHDVVRFCLVKVTIGATPGPCPRAQRTRRRVYMGHGPSRSRAPARSDDVPCRPRRLSVRFCRRHAGTGPPITVASRSRSMAVSVRDADSFASESSKERLLMPISHQTRFEKPMRISRPSRIDVHRQPTTTRSRICSQRTAPTTSMRSATCMGGRRFGTGSCRS